MTKLAIVSDVVVSAPFLHGRADAEHGVALVEQPGVARQLAYEMGRLFHCEVAALQDRCAVGFRTGRTALSTAIRVTNAQLWCHEPIRELGGASAAALARGWQDEYGRRQP